MAKIFIIADDLTGAADCGAVFAERGLETVVMLADARRGALNPAGFRGAEVLAIDTDTRCLGPEQSGRDVAQLVRALDAAACPDGNRPLLFKKVDSTLRGNVAAELAAALQARRAGTPGRVAVLFAPAFPAQGRTTVNGQQMVHGTLLEPCESSRGEIAAILREASLSSAAIELAHVRGAAPALESAMLDAANEVDVLVCDAETEEDLRAIGSAAMVLDPGTVWAGSAGLARHIPDAIGFTRPSDSRREAERAVPAQGPALFVVGSPAAASRAQAHALAAAPDVASFTLSKAAMLRGEQCPDWKRSAALVMERIALGEDVLVQFDSDASFSREQGRPLARLLAHMIAPCAGRIGALVATGGETARAILDAWGIQRLRLLGEIEPGLPYSVAQCANRNVLILTKAGGFGTPGTLLRCGEFLRNLARHPAVIELQTRATSERADMHKPIIAITMGDAAGVGPEIIMKALAHRNVYQQCHPLVIGDAQRLRQADRICETRLTVLGLSTEEIDQATYRPGNVDCVDLKLIPPDLPWAQLSAQAGEGAYQYLAIAAQLALEGKVGAICTAPLNKEALHAAGHKFPGHTEILAYLTGTPEVSMMLSTPKLKVLHVTTHIGLLDAIAKIEPGLVERTIARGRAALEKSGIADPRIGVCGINPHAGENGLFGHGEEEQKIVPAIHACRQRGWNVEGPLPADTLFYRAQRGDFDLVIAMYHDQGHGPVKVLGLESGVNITIGLPVVRTSVDHGTAFDIAGTGKADERSLLEAIRQAVQLAPRSSD